MSLLSRTFSSASSWWPSLLRAFFVYQEIWEFGRSGCLSLRLLPSFRAINNSNYHWRFSSRVRKYGLIIAANWETKRKRRISQQRSCFFEIPRSSWVFSRVLSLLLPPGDHRFWEHSSCTRSTPFSQVCHHMLRESWQLERPYSRIKRSLFPASDF